MQSKPLIRCALLVVTTLMVLFAQEKPGTWTPDTDWGHWRLGQKADLEFLKTNNMTITFGSGAPSFEDVTREEFNRGMEQAKTNNRALHDRRGEALDGPCPESDRYASRRREASR